ncbi:MAG: hypothetical protein KAW41_00340 [Candidatus Diapherotrites archaeon]|nr:hypothetical protein [Candidatus Diapherotrites archaeon]
MPIFKKRRKRVLKPKEKWSPYSRGSEKIGALKEPVARKERVVDKFRAGKEPGAWKKYFSQQGRVELHKGEELFYQKALNKLGEKARELRREKTGVGQVAVDSTKFFFVPPEHLRGVAWRNLTPEGRVARTALLKQKQKEFTNQYGEEQGMRQYNEYLLKERVLTGVEAGLEAGVWGLALAPIPIGGKSGAVGIRLAGTGMERVAAKLVGGGLEKLAVKGAEKLAVKGAEELAVKGVEKFGVAGAEELAVKGAEKFGVKGAEELGVKGAEEGAKHTVLDAGKHELPAFVSSLKTKFGGSWLGEFIASHKGKKRPSPL